MGKYLNKNNVIKKSIDIISKNLKITIFLLTVLAALLVIAAIYEQYSHPREDYNEYDYTKLADKIQICYNTYPSSEEMTEREWAENFRLWRTCILAAQTMD